MLDRISFVIGEALIGLRRNGFMTFSSVTTVAIALYLLGGLGFVYVKAMTFAHTIPSKFEIRVFLKDTAAISDISDTAIVIRSMPGVATVALVPRDKAWAKYREEHPDRTQGIENPFPNALKVTLSDLDKADALEQNIRALPAVDPSPDGVRRLAAEQRLIEQLIKLLGWMSSAGIVLLGIAGVLIFNTIRLAILSRRIEIRIMQLVGASRWTMVIPFLLEGLLHGMIGGSLAALFVWASYHTVDYRVHQSLELSSSWPPFPASQMISLLAAIGAGFGALCSVLALRVRQQG